MYTDHETNWKNGKTDRLWMRQAEVKQTNWRSDRQGDRHDRLKDVQMFGQTETD